MLSETLTVISSNLIDAEVSSQIALIQKIWSELKKRMRHCSKEDCWLDTIKDINVKNKLHDSSFAPKHPEEWNSDPSTWLSNLDILDVLSQYEEAYSHFHFIGPTPIDFDSKPYLFSEQCVWKELCNFKLKDYVDQQITKIGVIINLDKHDESGSHWTSMFVDLEEGIIFYFDSNGTSIPNEINKLKTNNVCITRGLCSIRFMWNDNIKNSNCRILFICENVKH